MDSLVGERIKVIRTRAGLGQAEFAEKLGSKQISIHRYEKGHRQPKAALLARMAEVFGVDVDWILTGRAGSAGDGATKIPLLRHLPDDLSSVPPDKVESYISLPDLPLGTFAIRIIGDDMLPLLREGDIVVFFTKAPEEGDLVLFRDRMGRARVRRLNRDLIAEHPEYPPMKIGAEARVIGKVVRAVRYLRY